MNLKKDIGLRIKQLRQEMKMSQEKFSEMINIKVTVLSEIENGHRNITLDSLQRIIEKFNENILLPKLPVITKEVKDKIESIDFIKDNIEKLDLEIIKVISTIIKAYLK